jgi:aryl-alcohol dehydrogenase-like predicted oxidoreductase
MRTGLAATVAGILGPELWGQLNDAIRDDGKPLPKRPLGKTGERLSIIGLGGIVVMGGTQQDANARVGEALDRGVNYFDVAPTYGRGEAEQKLGPALKPHRDRVFLACKTQKRDRAGAEAELNASLKQLQTDHFDLYQMHAIRDVEKDVKRSLAPGGAAEAFVEARKQGKVRFLGFSAHSAEAALAAIESGVFDTILYPVNFVCHQRGQFDQEVLKAAEAKGMGRLALKAMALTRWPKGSKRQDRAQPKCWYQPVDDPALVALALRWTLGQGVTAALPPGDEKLFHLALNVASLEAKLAPQEVTALRTVAEKHEPIFARPQA